MFLLCQIKQCCTIYYSHRYSSISAFFHLSSFLTCSLFLSLVVSHHPLALRSTLSSDRLICSLATVYLLICVFGVSWEKWIREYWCCFSIYMSYKVSETSCRSDTFHLKGCFSYKGCYSEIARKERESLLYCKASLLVWFWLKYRFMCITITATNTTAIIINAIVLFVTIFHTATSSLSSPPPYVHN